MKRNLLFISLLALSGASIVADTVEPVRKHTNSKGQGFVAGPKAEGPRSKSNNPVPLQNQAPSQEELKGTSDFSVVSETPVELQKVPEGSSEQSQVQETEKAGWFAWATKENAQAQLTALKESTSAGFTSASEYAKANPKTAMGIAIAAGSTLGLGLRYVWGKSKTAACSLAAVTGTALGALAYNNQALVKENSTLVAVATVATVAGVFAKDVWSYFGNKKRSRRQPLSSCC